LTAQKFGFDLSLVADIHGATLEEAIYAGRLAPDDEVVKVYKKDEKDVLNQSDWLIFVSNAMRKYYEGLAQDTFVKSSVIPCATGTSFEIDESRRDFLRSRFGLDGKIVFCYVGSAAPYQMIGEMVQLFDKITSYISDAFFLIFSHHQDVFLGYMKGVAISPSRYQITAVDHDEIFDYLQMGDIGFLLRENSIVNRVASPTKFAEYCLCGLPVITTAYVGDFSAMVRDHKLGYVFDLSGLSVDTNLTNFVRDVQQNRSMYAKRCADFAKENFSWEHYGSLLSDIYRRVEKS
jgi:glycosyltransferase involved in cell wall biosynthesis